MRKEVNLGTWNKSDKLSHRGSLHDLIMEIKIELEKKAAYDKQEEARNQTRDFFANL
jgi:hypothetical protein